jgi:polyisoprenoid-binding protein YceI
MTVPAGHHQIGADRDRLILRTSRDGLAAQAGHDLTIEVTRWSGELTVDHQLAPVALDVRIDLGSLEVRSGTGGITPLAGRDKREIAVTAGKTLGTDKYPEATFGDAEFEPGAHGGGVISGTLSLAGRSHPVRLQVTQTEPGRYHATGSVIQSSFGIKPYRGFFGALRVRDTVDVEVDVDLSRVTGTRPG